MSARRPLHRTRRAAGFTLLELMVALTIGGLAISAMYTIGSTLVKQYHGQAQAANALTSVRVALNQMKRDIARAGYMATPNLVPGGPHATQGCLTNYTQHQPGGSGSLAAISRVVNDVCATGTVCDNLHGGTSVATTNRGNGFTSDSVVLFGNYETSNEYPNVQLVTSTRVSVGRSAHSYQSDFTNWYEGAATPDVNAFARVFAPGRLVRIRTTGGQYHFATVASVSAQTTTTDAQVTLGAQIQPAACQTGTEGGWIAPVNAIRYFPRNDPNPPTPNGWGPMAQLVRQEVEPGDKVTPLMVTEPSNNAHQYANTRVVLDYLVSFNLGFVMKTQDPAVGSPDPVYTPGNAVAGFAAVNTNPEWVRAVTIELSARTPAAEWGLAPAACANLRCFQLPGELGTARVRTLRTEVFVPNIAYESF